MIELSVGEFEAQALELNFGPKCHLILKDIVHILQVLLIIFGQNEFALRM